jgi:hypothetical protein
MLTIPRITEVAVAGYGYDVLNRGIQETCQKSFLRLGVTPFLVAATKRFPKKTKGTDPGSK